MEGHVGIQPSTTCSTIQCFRIGELYDLVLRTHSVGSDVLPAVVDRLEALQGLHEQGDATTIKLRAFVCIKYRLVIKCNLGVALSFSKSVAELENVQQKLEVSLGNNERLLKETQKK